MPVSPLAAAAAPPPAERPAGAAAERHARAAAERPARAAAEHHARAAAGDAFEAMVLEKMLTTKSAAQSDSKNNDWRAMANHAFATTLAASHPFDVAGMLTKDNAQ